ncbi:MAG: hypothetical protein ACP5PJ_09485, partial [Acidimicrobiales bacterium]
MNLEPLSPATLITSGDVERPFVLFNPTGPVRAMNAAAEVLLGVTSQEAVGVLRAFDLISTSAPSGMPSLGQTSATKTQRALEVHISTLRDTAGRIHGELWELIDPGHARIGRPLPKPTTWSWFAADANGSRSPLLERLFAYAMAAHDENFDYENLRA